MNKEKRRNKFNNTSNSKRTKVSEENIPEEGEVSEEEILEPIIIQSEDEEVKKNDNSKERSMVWKHFEKYTDSKNVIWAKCRHCR